MKINIVYATAITLVSALVTLILFFMGAHNDVAKMQATSWIGTLSGFVIPIVGLFFALRATREASPDGSLSYGKGVLTSLIIGLIAGVLGAIFQYIYGAIINPGMYDTIREVQVAALEAQGKLSQEQIDQASAMMSKFANPVVTSIFVVVLSPVFYTIFGLIVSTFVKRAPAATPPPTPAVA